MSKNELMARMQTAANLIDLSDLENVELVTHEDDTDAFSDYWANSASQSYVNAVESGNIKQA